MFMSRCSCRDVHGSRPCVARGQHFPLVSVGAVPVNVTEFGGDAHFDGAAPPTGEDNAARLDASENGVELARRNTEAIVLYGKALVGLDEIEGQPVVEIDRREWTGARFPPRYAEQFGEALRRGDLVAAGHDEVIELHRHLRISSLASFAADATASFCGRLQSRDSPVRALLRSGRSTHTESARQAGT